MLLARCTISSSLARAYFQTSTKIQRFNLFLLLISFCGRQQEVQVAVQVMRLELLSRIDTEATACARTSWSVSQGAQGKSWTGSKLVRGYNLTHVLENANHPTTTTHIFGLGRRKPEHMEEPTRRTCKPHAHGAEDGFDRPPTPEVRGNSANHSA